MKELRVYKNGFKSSKIYFSKNLKSVILSKILSSERNIFWQGCGDKKRHVVFSLLHIMNLIFFPWACSWPKSTRFITCRGDSIRIIFCWKGRTGFYFLLHHCNLGKHTFLELFLAAVCMSCCNQDVNLIDCQYMTGFCRVKYWSSILKACSNWSHKKYFGLGHDFSNFICLVSPLLLYSCYYEDSYSFTTELEFYCVLITKYSM